MEDDNSTVVESRFAWMGDAIDTKDEVVKDQMLPQRSREQALKIENYASTLNAYKTSKMPAYTSARTSSKKAKKSRTDDEESASIISPIFVRDARGTSGEQVAHILPHDTGCAIFYEAPIVGALGVETDENGTPIPMTRIEKQSLNHGSRGRNVIARKVADWSRPARRMLRKRKAPRADTDMGAKVYLSGLKHCALNKIQLMEHKPYDKFPYMILTPALSREEILGWTPGTEYSIICLVGETTTEEETADYRDRFDRCQDATKDEVMTAVMSLRTFVLGLACSLCTMEDFDDIVTHARKHDNLEPGELDPLRATRVHPQTEKTIRAPLFSATKFAAVKIT